MTCWLVACVVGFEISSTSAEERELKSKGGKDTYRTSSTAQVSQGIEMSEGK